LYPPETAEPNPTPDFSSDPAEARLGRTWSRHSRGRPMFWALPQAPCIPLWVEPSLGGGDFHNLESLVVPGHQRFKLSYTSPLLFFFMQAFWNYLIVVCCLCSATCVHIAHVLDIHNLLLLRAWILLHIWNRSPAHIPLNICIFIL
jgi:hypothetical protein